MTTNKPALRTKCKALAIAKLVVENNLKVQAAQIPLVPMSGWSAAFIAEQQLQALSAIYAYPAHLFQAKLSGKLDKRRVRRYNKSTIISQPFQFRTKQIVMLDEMDKYPAIPSCTDPIDESVCGECNECSTYCDVCAAWYWDEEPCGDH